MKQKLSRWSKSVQIAMIKQNLSRGQLAKNIGRSPQYLSAVVCQRVKSPEMEKLISDYLNIPNEGKRSRLTGARLKEAGLKSGVPDVCLPVARGGYIGLYIENKYGKNKPTENQKRWLRALRAAGHLVAVCYGWEQAKELIESYLALPPTIIEPKGDSNED